ncbi:MAG: CPBP family intramembrane metalloprotease [Ardenticatenaceae bacterium]|nr:CPBP family intramembrane metalloprotease [Ardenticatenaceae bacterium]
MKRMKKLAAQNPIVFGLIIFLGLFLTVIISALLANQWPAESPGWYITATAVRVVSIIILLALLSGLGWLSGAGFLWLGRLQTWLLIILPLVYAIVVTAYAMTGHLDFSVSESGLSVTVALFIITAAFLEEIAFRGLILHAFVRVWGETNRGFVKAVLVAALFFGAYHLINILGGLPLPEVLLQSAVNFSMGIFLGGLVLYGRSIYPVVFFHVCWNMAGYLNLTDSTAWGSSASWLMLTVLCVPLAIFGFYLLRDMRQRSLELETA